MSLVVIILLALVLQAVIAGGVVFALTRKLHRELVESALEALHAASLPASTAVSVVSYKELDIQTKAQLLSMLKRKGITENISFTEDKALKAGIVITAAEDVLDFALSSRWEQCWS